MLFVYLHSSDWRLTHGVTQHRKQKTTAESVHFIMLPDHQDIFLDTIRTRLVLEQCKLSKERILYSQKDYTVVDYKNELASLSLPCGDEIIFLPPGYFVHFAEQYEILSSHCSYQELEFENAPPDTNPYLATSITRVNFSTDFNNMQLVRNCRKLNIHHSEGPEDPKELARTSLLFEGYRIGKVTYRPHKSSLQAQQSRFLDISDMVSYVFEEI